MKDIMWNDIMIRELCSVARLTDREKTVLHDWADDVPIWKTAQKCSVSDRTINNDRDSIRKKYDSVSIYSPLLPKRQALT